MPELTSTSRCGDTRNMKTPWFPLAALLAAFAWVTIAANNANAQGRSLYYPFDVTVAGQPAVPPRGAAETFAKVSEPVAPDARFDLDTEGSQIIVNIFPIDEKGAILPGAQVDAKIIMVENGTGFDLDAIHDKTTLVPGLYGMYIMLEREGTSRVRIAVGTPEELATAQQAKSARTGSSDLSLPDQAAQKVQPAAAINLYGSERLGVAPPSMTTATTTTPTAKSDRSTPNDTVRLFIELAKAGKFEAIRELAAPDADGDVREACAIGDASNEDQLRFQSFFGGGKTLGAARVDGDRAEVDFTMGDKQKREETMHLQRIAGIWFLSHF